MKKLLSIAFIVAAGLYFTSCEQNPQSANNPFQMQTTANSATTANPAIAYTTTVTTKNKTYVTVAAMDTDGTHQGNVYTASTTAEIVNVRPSWSPSGGSVAFFTHGGSDGTCIKTLDVGQSNGKPTGSNVTKIYTDANLTGTVSWSSLSATSKIAFITRPAGATATAKIQTISSSGGTATVLYQSPANETHIYKSPTWSSNDSVIAFIDRNGANNATATEIIRIIDATTGTQLDSITVSSSLYRVNYIEWSRSGSDNLALDVNVTSTGANTLYYLTPTSGSTPSTNNVAGESPSWSPNNSSVITWNSGTTALRKTVAGATTTSTIVTGAGYYGTWKR